MSVRFRVRELPAEDDAGWIRVSKAGRERLGKKAGEKVLVSVGKHSVDGLIIHEGLRDDSGKLIVRLSQSVLQRLRVSYGDTVEIEPSGGVSDSKKKGTGAIKKGVPEICVLALDCSESMRGSKFEQARKAAEGFLDAKTRMSDGDRVGCVGFDGEAYVVFDPTADFSAAKSKLSRLNLRLGTDIGKVLDLARDLICNERGRGGKAKGDKAAKQKADDALQRHVILLADGNGNPDSPPKAADLCKKARIVVDVVGILDTGGKLQEHLLRRIAEITGGRYRSVDDKSVSDLARIYRRWAEKEDI
jgi:Mg-chelatase subunit ChlD